MAYDFDARLPQASAAVILIRWVVLSEAGVITAAGMPIKYNLFRRPEPQPRLELPGLMPWKQFKRQSERDYLHYALTAHDYHIAAAARELELSPRQIYNKINEYGLAAPGPARHKPQAD